MKRDGKVWIRIFPDKPVSKKPLETRMGKGKGAPEFWVAVIKPGRILFEVGGVSREVANDALQICGYKIPAKTANEHVKANNVKEGYCKNANCVKREIIS